MRKWAICLAALSCVSAWGQSSQSAKPESAHSRSLEAPSASYPADLARSAAPPKITLPSSSLPSSASVPVPRIVLPPLSEAEIQSVQNKPSTEMRTRVGLTRKLEFSAAERGVRVAIEKDKELWMLETVSTGAKMVRLHFTGFNLPEGTKLYLSGVTGPENVVVFEGKGPFNDGEFWSPIFAGDTVHLEMVTEGSKEEEFLVTQVGHVFAAKLESAEPQSCNLDAACYPEWNDSGDAVAKIVFNDSQYIYLCSAVLLNNNSGDFSPLLLTANHCVTNEALAKTVSTLWFYRSNSCNGGSPNPGSYTYGSGARFLAGNAGSDASLLEVLGMLPSTVKFAGWKIEAPPIGELVTGIHHPNGSYRRISFGSLYSDEPSFPNFHRVIYSAGMVEPGSSGSPLFNSAHQVIGQLYGGNASCTNQSGDLGYGKLGISYPFFKSAGGKNYLQEGLPDDAFAPNHTRETAAILVNGTYENLVLRFNYPDWFEIKPPEGYLVTVESFWGMLGSTADVGLYRDSEAEPIMVGTDVGFNRLEFGGKSVNTTRYFVKASVREQNPMRLGYRMVVNIAQPPLPRVAFFDLAPQSETTAAGRAFVTSRTDATLVVEYSRNSSFTDMLSVQVPVSGSRTQDRLISFALTGLTSDTTYYYRLAIDNGLEVGRTSDYRELHTFATSISLDKTNLDFGTQAARTTKFLPIKVTNTGSATWVYAGVSFTNVTFFDNPWVATHNCGAGLQPGNTCEIDISFTPWYPAGHVATAWVESNSVRTSIEIRGIGSGAQAYVLNAFTNFGQTIWLNIPSRPRGFELRNSGNLPLTLSTFAVSRPFTINGDDCPSVVPVGASCYFSVSYTPTSVGEIEGNIEVAHLGLDSPARFKFWEYAQDLQLSLSRPRRPGRSLNPESATEQRFDLTLAPSAGTLGEVQLSCQGAPKGVTCLVSPDRIPLSGGPTVTSVIVQAPIRSARLRSRTSSTLIFKVNATIQGVTKSIDLPVQIER